MWQNTPTTYFWTVATTLWTVHYEPLAKIPAQIDLPARNGASTVSGESTLRDSRCRSLADPGLIGRNKSTINFRSHRPTTARREHTHRLRWVSTRLPRWVSHGAARDDKRAASRFAGDRAKQSSKGGAMRVTSPRTKCARSRARWHQLYSP